MLYAGEHSVPKTQTKEGVYGNILHPRPPMGGRTPGPTARTRQEDPDVTSVTSGRLMLGTQPLGTPNILHKCNCRQRTKVVDVEELYVVVGG